VLPGLNNYLPQVRWTEEENKSTFVTFPVCKTSYARNTLPKMKRILLPTLAAILIMGCSQQPAATADAVATGVERTVKEITITDGTPVTYADLSIDGMSCEMMCGGSIKKALAKLPGIAQTEIKFVEGDERDHAIVTYDESKVTDAQMIEAIHGLYDGQYKVLAVDITKQVKGEAVQGSIEKNAGNNKQVSVRAPSAVQILPSVLALLTQIMRL